MVNFTKERVRPGKALFQGDRAGSFAMKSTGWTSSPEQV